jgi:hypothetical protein
MSIESVMNHKAYILLDVIEGSIEEVARVLRKELGVVIVDTLEGPTDVVVLIEAPEREQLAK